MQEPTDGKRQPVIDRPLANQLTQFKGRWVAIFNDQVVADGESAPEVLRIALGKGITDPLIFRVPVHPERLNLF